MLRRRRWLREGGELGVPQGLPDRIPSHAPSWALPRGPRSDFVLVAGFLSPCGALSVGISVQDCGDPEPIYKTRRGRKWFSQARRTVSPSPAVGVLGWRHRARSCSTPTETPSQRRAQGRQGHTQAMPHRNGPRAGWFRRTEPVTLLLLGDSRKQKEERTLSSDFERPSRPPQATSLQEPPRTQASLRALGPPGNQTLSCARPHFPSSFGSSDNNDTFSKPEAQHRGAPVEYTSRVSWVRRGCCQGDASK